VHEFNNFLIRTLHGRIARMDQNVTIGYVNLFNAVVGVGEADYSGHFALKKRNGTTG